MRILIAGLFLAICAGAVSAQDKLELAKKAKGILVTHCYRCHGENGALEGGVNYLLDRQQLVLRKKVIPGEPAKSRVLKRIQLEEMPPEDERKRPTPEEIAILKQWISAGAPDFNPPIQQREFVTQAAIQDAISKDLNKLSENERRFTRYFSLAHLYNAGMSEDELTSFRHGLSKLMNSLSWGKRVVPPTAIDAAKTIYRIDLRDYKWTEKNWDLLESFYPYGLAVKTDIEKKCQNAMRTQFVYLRGDWFVASAALPPLYHDLLNLPHSDSALEKELHVSVRQNLKDGLAMRAAFNGSGVSRNNRLIERHETIFGAYWKSYDFGGNTGRQNLFAIPLGPGTGATHFQHDGGEIIFNLPNGLQAYLLVDAHGRRIDKGPTEIVSDPRRPDRAVVNGLSCMSCHARGIIVKDDQVRAHVEKNRQAFLKDELKSILSLYAKREKMMEAMEEDAQRFRNAVEKTGSRIGATEPIVALTLRFEAEIDLPLAAAEFGMPADELRKLFDKSVSLGRLLGPLAVDGGTVHRDVFTDAYANVIRDLELGAVVAPAKKLHSWTGRSQGWSPPVSWAPPPVGRSAPAPVPTKPQAWGPGLSGRYEDPWYYKLSRHSTGQLHAVAISPTDRTVLAVESEVGVVSLFGRTGQVRMVQLGRHKGSVLSIDFAPDGQTLATGGIDQTARLWNLALGHETGRFDDHAGFVRAVKFSPDGKWLATGSERVRLMNATTGREKFRFDKATGWIESLAFSPNGKIIAAAGKGVQLWDTATGELAATLGESTETILAIAFEPTGKHIAVAHADGAIRFWDVAARKPILMLKGHQQPVTSLAFLFNGKLLVSTAGDRNAAADKAGEFKVWNPDSGDLLASQLGHTRAISSVAIAADGRHAITASLDGHIRIRELMSFDKVALEPFEGHFGPVGTSSISRDAKRMLSGGYDRTVRLWDFQTGVSIHRLQGHEQPVRGVAFSPDTQYAYSASADRTVRKWDLARGKEVQRWDLPSFATGLALSADGKTLAVALGGQNAWVWNPLMTEKPKEFKGVDQLALSRDGTRLAGAQIKGTTIWDLSSGKEMARLDVYQPRQRLVTFSADGKFLLTGSKENVVHLWDAPTGQKIRSYPGHTQEIRSIAFCDDDRKVIASGGALKVPFTEGKQEYIGCSVILWDKHEGKELRRWDTSPKVVRVIVHDQSGSVFFIGDDHLKKPVHLKK